MSFDEKGRCCGRKPIDYKLGRMTDLQLPHKYCPRCDRAFDSKTGEQIPNWAWERVIGTRNFRKRHREDEV